MPPQPKGGVFVPAERVLKTPRPHDWGRFIAESEAGTKRQIEIGLDRLQLANDGSQVNIRFTNNL
jgi:hypothetical protein